jgi:hypothetical protein
MSISIAITIDGNAAVNDCFGLPEMSLSSSRSMMSMHCFELVINKRLIQSKMAPLYHDWVTESMKDDSICGSPQDELAEAGYPPLEVLLENSQLTELLIGSYLLQELFDEVMPVDPSKIRYWLDQITSAECDGEAIKLMGVCYSSRIPGQYP